MKLRGAVLGLLFNFKSVNYLVGKRILLLKIVLLYLTSPVFSQESTIVPSDLLPGAILQDIQQKTVPSNIQPDTQQQEASPAPVEGIPQEETQPARQQPDSAEKVLIKTIEVQGVTLLSKQKIRALVSHYENQELTFEKLQALANQLTQLYRDKGYVTSRVYIPPQKLQNEKLILQALEGRTGRIIVTEGRFFKTRSVEPRISLKTSKPFNVKILSRNLRQINENPDRTTSASLKPGEQTGETEIHLEVEDRLPVHLTPSFDNLGRETIGKNRFGLQLAQNNLLGFGDQVLSSLSFTRRSFGIVNHYQLSIGSHGTSIGFEHAYSQLKLGGDFEPLDVQGIASTYTPYLSQDILNTKNYKLSTDIAFDFKRLDTDILGSNFTHDRLRILRPTLTLESFDKGGRTYLRNEFGIGLDIFGGTIGDENTASRAGAGTKFFTYTGSLVRTQKLPFSSFGIFRIIGQASPDRLVSSQQFQSGGAFTVRGYREGELIGDKGLLTSIELRTPLLIIPTSWKIPGTRYSLRNNIQLVSFADYGATFINKPIAGFDNSEHILGIGLGIRTQLTKKLIGRVDWGFPILKQPGNDRPRIHFGIQSNLF